MTKKKQTKTDWKEIDKIIREQEDSIDTGKAILYEDIMKELENKQIDSKPHTDAGQGFVDGYNCGIRDAMRIAYRSRFIDFDWDADTDPWDIDSDVAGEALVDLLDGKY